MADKSFSKILEEKIAQIEQIVAAIAQDAEETKLRELRNVLISLAGVIERDPGIEMASDDVYSAGLIVVSDAVIGTRPYSRKQRLLVSASERLVSRLERIREGMACDDEVAAPAPSYVVPFQIGFDGSVGPRPMCEPAL